MNRFISLMLFGILILVGCGDGSHSVLEDDVYNNKDNDVEVSLSENVSVSKKESETEKINEDLDLSEEKEDQLSEQIVEKIEEKIENVEIDNDEKDSNNVEEEDKETGVVEEQVSKEKSKQEEKTEKVENNKKELKTKDTFKVEKFSGDYMSKVSLNVRSKPSLNSKVVSVLSPGNKVNIIGKTTFENMEWYQVQLSKDLIGWSSASYLYAYDVNFKKELEKKKEQEKKKQSSYKPNTIYFNGKAVPYKNGGRANGQAIIDGWVYASTWGGTTAFSGTDGKNTHFIGHNPGQFTGMHLSKEFIITDGNGKAFRYVVDRVYKVNEYAVGVADGKNYWDRIVGTGGGERITLQSTYDHPIKWIVEASPR